MLVCRGWQRIVHDAIDSGLYTDAIQMHSDPSELPAQAWRWMTMTQKIGLTEAVRVRMEIENLRLLSMKHTIRWSEIVRYYSRQQVHRHDEAKDHIINPCDRFARVYVHFEQFRVYLSEVMDGEYVQYTLYMMLIACSRNDEVQMYTDGSSVYRYLNEIAMYEQWHMITSDIDAMFCTQW